MSGKYPEAWPAALDEWPGTLQGSNWYGREALQRLLEWAWTERMETNLKTEGRLLFREMEYQEEELPAVGIEVTGMEGMVDSLSIPDKVDGKSVVSLAPYAFQNHREIKRVFLPDSIQKIGGHCFYDCRNLSVLSLSDRVLFMEDGAFKNCESMEEVRLSVLVGKSTCLKNILSELNQTLLVRLSYGEQKAGLIFPRYQLDYEANVEARIINQVTYGSGIQYRECFSYEDVDYKKYDALFYTEQNIGEEAITARLCAERLLWPYLLSRQAEEGYQNYLLQEDAFQQAFEWYLSREGELDAFCGYVAASGKLLSMALSFVQKKERPEVAALLMEHRHKAGSRETGRKKDLFEL